MTTPSNLAQYVNNVRNISPYFSDFSTNFDMSPNSGDLALIIDTAAVTQSIENIINTFVGERLYNNTIGSNVMHNLFELGNYAEAENIKSAIMSAIKINEPRANVIKVDVSIVVGEENIYLITITYYVINNTVPQTLTVKIKRTR